MVADRPVDIALLHHLPASRVLCWHNILRGDPDERYGAEALKRRLTGAAPAVDDISLTSSGHSPSRPSFKNSDIIQRHTVP